MAAIRNMCKIKYTYVREHGGEAPNELCFEEIEKFERGMKAAEDERKDPAPSNEAMEE
jgi:general transcription factor 3C polypeptide 5 (transcription factor C subunit 1)